MEISLRLFHLGIINILEVKVEIFGQLVSRYLTIVNFLYRVSMIGSINGILAYMQQCFYVYYESKDTNLYIGYNDFR